MKLDMMCRRVWMKTSSPYSTPDRYPDSPDTFYSDGHPSEGELSPGRSEGEYSPRGFNGENVYRSASSSDEDFNDSPAKIYPPFPLTDDTSAIGHCDVNIPTNWDLLPPKPKSRSSGKTSYMMKDILKLDESKDDARSNHRNSVSLMTPDSTEIRNSVPMEVDDSQVFSNSLSPPRQLPSSDQRQGSPNSYLCAHFPTPQITPEIPNANTAFRVVSRSNTHTGSRLSPNNTAYSTISPTTPTTTFSVSPSHSGARLSPEHSARNLLSPSTPITTPCQAFFNPHSPISIMPKMYYNDHSYQERLSSAVDPQRSPSTPPQTQPTMFVNSLSTNAEPPVAKFPESNTTTIPSIPTTPNEGFPCKWRDCSALFYILDDLVHHVNDAHVKADRDVNYKCYWQNCARNGRGFNARYKMLIHVRTHTNEKPHLCAQCGKSFSRLENLKIHKRSHTGERPYICPFEGCKKAYSNSSDRFKHVRTHQMQKPYICRTPGCDKRYTDPSSLRKHIKTHGHYFRGPPTKKEELPSQSSPPKKSQNLTPLNVGNYTYNTLNGGFNNSDAHKNIEFSRKVDYSPNTQTATNFNSSVVRAPSSVLQNAIVTISPMGGVNHSLPTQVISIQGNILDVANLASNPLLSSAISNINTTSASTQTDIDSSPRSWRESSPTRKDFTVREDQDCPLDLRVSPEPDTVYHERSMSPPMPLKWEVATETQ